MADDHDTLHAALVALARLEEKVDTLLRKQTAIGEEIKTLDVETNKRLSALEVTVAALESRVNSRLPWPGVTAAIVAIIGVAMVVAERIYGG